MLLRTVLAATLIAVAGSAANAQCGAPGTANSEPKLRENMVITTEWLAEHLHDPNLVVLSVGSTPEFYSKGHIPGARQVLLSEIVVTRDGIPNELPPVEKL